MVGDIEDGLIENVTDDGQGRAHFARILTGAWVDWHEGIRVQRGDTVRCGKNLYRVLMPLGTKEYVSMEKPSHASGIWTDKSGLRFWFMQDNGISSANIRNVTFRNIYLRSPRPGLRGDWENPFRVEPGHSPGSQTGRLSRLRNPDGRRLFRVSLPAGFRQSGPSRSG